MAAPETVREFRVERRRMGSPAALSSCGYSIFARLVVKAIRYSRGKEGGQGLLCAGWRNNRFAGLAKEKNLHPFPIEDKNLHRLSHYEPFVQNEN